jgi:hypothetical protein
MLWRPGAIRPALPMSEGHIHALPPVRRPETRRPSMFLHQMTAPTHRPVASALARPAQDFAGWWCYHRSGLAPLPNEDREEHARRVALAAFLAAR